MKNIILCSILICICFNLFIYSQIKEPESPYSPDIDSNIDKDNFIVKARVALQGNDKPFISLIALSSDVLIVGDNRFKVSDLTKINILMWKRAERKLNSYIFYPDRYELYFRDYRSQIINGNIESLNKIRVVGKKNNYIYLYYFDYFKDGKWINSGGKDFDAAITTPIDGGVISIELIE